MKTYDILTLLFDINDLRENIYMEHRFIPYLDEMFDYYMSLL